MSCNSVCKFCNKLIFSQSVTFTGGNVVINIPAGSYSNNSKYCICVIQPIPTTATINAPVFITIGTGTVLYPLTTKNCRQVTACGIRTRTRYSTCVVTNATGASFRMLGQPCCSPNNQLASVNGTAPVAADTPTEPVSVASVVETTTTGKASK